MTSTGKFPTLHSVLDDEALRQEIAGRYDLGKDVHCELLTRGVNDVYTISARDKRWAARVWRANLHSQSDIDFEMTYLDFLAKADQPVIAPIPAKDGSLFFSLEAPEGTRSVCLFEWAPGGQFATSATKERARRIGAAMAHIHLAARTFKPKAPRPVDYKDSIPASLPFLLKRLFARPADRDFYSRSTAALATMLNTVKPGEIPRWAIHGDIHARNVFFGPDDSLHVLDFDACGEAPLVQDLASFVWANSYIGLDPACAPLLGDTMGNAFLEGYESVRPLEPRERALYPAFLAAKELSLLSESSRIINVMGLGAFRFAGFDWFAASIRRHMAAAGIV